MAGPILYSTNPWLAHEFSKRYRGGNHFVWCSEFFDPASAPSGSAASAIAPSSSPKGIYGTLGDDCRREDRHSALIKGYRKTFLRLATQWLAAAEITDEQHGEIVATVKSQSWRIWRPLLYIIPREPIESMGRLRSVPHRHRAAYGPELQIADLAIHEFDIIEGAL